MTRRGTASIVASPVLVGAVTVLVIIVAVFLAYNANQGQGDLGGTFTSRDFDLPGSAGPTFTGVPSLQKIDGGAKNSLRNAP